MRRFIPVSIALALAGTTLVAGSAATSTAAAPAAGTKVKTPFALTANAFGTRVIGGDVPVGSSPTGYKSLSCTNRAGINKTNNVAEVNIPGLGTVKGVSTRTWTTKVGDVVSSMAEHSVARINLLKTPLGDLDLNGISSYARAYHDASGFHSETKTKVASLTFTPPQGKPVELELPTVDQPLTIPGLAKISLGTRQKAENATSAIARASAITIEMLATDTQIVVGSSKATISNGIKRGVFGGAAIGVHARALGNLVGVGDNPLQYMPCRGTQGKVLSQHLAGVDIAGLLKLSGLGVSAYGNQTKAKAVGQETAHVAKVDIGGGQVVVNGVTAKATVTRTKKGVTRATSGGVAEIFVGNELVTIPPLGVLEVPGLVKIEDHVVENSKNGVKVVGLRLTLLNGTGAVIELAVATLGIKGTGLKG